MHVPTPLRRRLLQLGAATTASLGLPAWALSRQTPLPSMTEGPFYPPKRWRGAQADWDADLTRVQQGSQTWVAQGEHLGLNLRVVDNAGKAIDRVEFEIWQCDVAALYRHPGSSGSDERFDKGFQGFGAGLTDADGQVRFRTIKPVAYPGRTPHIHVKLRHPGFKELTSQLFLSGDPGNARDGIWRRLGAQQQAAVDMVLQAAQGEGLRWRVEHTIVVEA